MPQNKTPFQKKAHFCPKNSNFHLKLKKKIIQSLVMFFRPECIIQFILLRKMILDYNALTLLFVKIELENFELPLQIELTYFYLLKG